LTMPLSPEEGAEPAHLAELGGFTDADLQRALTRLVTLNLVAPDALQHPQPHASLSAPPCVALVNCAVGRTALCQWRAGVNTVQRLRRGGKRCRSGDPQYGRSRSIPS
jgi:hypothetical protein